MAPYKVDFSKTEWDTPADGIRAKVCKLNGRQLRLVEYAKDLKPHWCAKGHIGYVLDGQMEITIDDKVLVFNPGDGVYLPAGDKHQHMAKMLTDVVRVIFVEDA